MAQPAKRPPSLGWRDAAASWAGPLTIAVAQQELERLEGAPGRAAPPVSDPLMALVFGGLAIRELTRRLGERVQAAIQSPPAYVTAMLGPYPEADLAIEGFRQECGSTTPSTPSEVLTCTSRWLHGRNSSP